jgi:mono/diheme cytochrome c family protein
MPAKKFQLGRPLSAGAQFAASGLCLLLASCVRPGGALSAPDSGAAVPSAPLAAARAPAAAATAVAPTTPSAPAAATMAKAAPAGTGWEEFHHTVQPFFAKHCFTCHSGDDAENGFRLDVIKDELALKDSDEALEDVLGMLNRHKMPPSDEPQPAAAEVAPVVAWLQNHLVGDLNAPVNPGRVTLRRLNRAEYNNTIRDLLAIDFRPADNFPADDMGYGFDNNGDVLSMAPVLMEKYLTAADQALEKAIFVEPVVAPPVQHWEAAQLEGSIPKSDPTASVTRGTPEVGGGPRVAILLGRIFNYNGEIYTDCEIPADGDYILRVRAYGLAGSVTRQRPQVAFRLDGAQVQKPITIVEDQKNAAFDALEKMPLPAGKHRISLSFLNGATAEEYAIAKLTAPAPAAPVPVVNPNDDDDKPAAGRGRRGGGGGGPAGPTAQTPTGKPTLGVIAIELEGPLAPTLDRMPESYRRVMVAQPSATVSKAAAAEQIIRHFATRAYRRPVREDEVARLMALWAKGDADGRSFDQSIDHVLQAVLVSPAFLFRMELDPQAGEQVSGVHTLNEYELASRLSYFLWSSMPDDELSALAAKGQLRANLDAQVRRMLKDPKSSALVTNFASQWLQLRSMQNAAPDAALFPAFDESLRDAMTKETELFFNAIVQDDRSVLDFINADFTFVNERLAKHYGLPGVTGDNFRRVTLPPERGGLLAQASILTITSLPNRTSPVLRGKWVLENLLDAAPPPPPPNVPALTEAGQGQIKGTVRQRMEQHRKNPACASCHQEMDGIGFAMENFDAIGAWRSKDDGVEIDARGSLPGGKTFNGPAELRKVIQAQSEQFARCLANKMLTFALGRGLQPYDRRTSDAIVEAMRKNDNRFSTMIEEIVRSDAFQKRNGKPERGDS